MAAIKGNLTMSESNSRRRFLSTVLIAAAAPLAGRAFAAAPLPKLPLTNPQAQSLHYTEDASKAKDPAHKAGSMMSQNRQAARDRSDARSDYEVNVRAEMEIAAVHAKLDLLREQEWIRLVQTIEAQQRTLEAIKTRLDMLFSDVLRRDVFA